MKSSIPILTIVAAALLSQPQASLAQYAWVPVYAPESAPATSAPGVMGDQAAAFSATSSAHIGDLENFDDKGQGACQHDDDCKGGCGCQCPMCRHQAFFSRTFGSLEYMQWWNKGRALPPLVTTSPNGTPLGQAGVLPNAAVLFGNEAVGGDLHAGTRLTFGRWLGDDDTSSVVARVYGYEGDRTSFAADSAGNPILGRPFFNTRPIVNANDALVVAFPGRAGSVNDIADNDLQAFDISFRTMLDQGGNYRIDGLAGYHFAHIEDDLLMTTNIDDNVNTFQFVDLFETANTYNAIEAGVLSEVYRGRWTLSALGKISVGNMRQQVDINGFNRVNGAAATNGGLFTQPTNIGAYERDVTVWVPEAGLKVGYCVNDRITVTVGYTFLYFTRMALAGDQIDTNINSSQLTGGVLGGPADPTFAFRDTDFWVQSVDLGLSWAY